MAARPIWKGQLRLSLVSIPVELYSATKSGAKPSFRQIHEPTGKPIRYQKVVEGVGPVDKDEIMRGFEKDLLDVATTLIEKKTAKFDAKVFKDHYQAALRELIDRKLKSKGRKVTAKEEEAPARPSGENVVDLMAALKQSLEGTSGGKARAKSSSASKSKSKTTSTRKKAS